MSTPRRTNEEVEKSFAQMQENLAEIQNKLKYIVWLLASILSSEEIEGLEDGQA